MAGGEAIIVVMLTGGLLFISPPGMGRPPLELESSLGNVGLRHSTGRLLC